MKKFNFFKSNLGFSFVEILMAISILGIGILAFVNLTQNTTKDTRSADLNTVKLQYFNSFRSFINSSKGCKEIQDSSTVFQPLASQSLSLTSYQVGTKSKYFLIKSITAKYINDKALLLDNNREQSSLEIKLDLEVFRDLKKNAAAGSEGKTQESFYFSLPVVYDRSTKKIIRCDLENSAELSCAGVGGTLVGGNCKAYTSCKITGSFTDPDTSQYSSNLPGTNPLHKNFVTSQAGCPIGSDEFQTGYIDYVYQEPAGDKKASSGPPITQKIYFYTCMECKGTGNQPSGGTSGGATGVTSGGSIGGGGGGGCFIAGTEITLFDGSKKNIEDIGLGESLVDLKGSKVKVQKLISYDYDGPIYSINGGPYFFTPNHPFLTTSGWKSLDPKKSMEEAPGLKVSHLMLGDILLKKDGVEVILSLDSIHIKDKVYNFTLDGTHEYIANDFAVHNKIQALQQTL
jgi:hypothetical protein